MSVGWIPPMRGEYRIFMFFFFQAEDGIRDDLVTGVQTCALPIDITQWADGVQRLDAKHAGDWELPDLGLVAAPAAVLIRPDGYVAWVGEGTDNGLRDALTTWFGSP